MERWAYQRCVGVFLLLQKGLTITTGQAELEQCSKTAVTEGSVNIGDKRLKRYYFSLSLITGLGKGSAYLIKESIERERKNFKDVGIAF